jgi:ribosome-associated toxin RatA of RatAB toxin-antitoxin module
MGLIRGERSVEIAAPIAAVYAIAADVERAPEWQGSMTDAEVLSRDAEGRPEVVETVNDAKIKSIRTTLRFSYVSPHRVEWIQEKGEVKSLHGWWELEDLGDNHTRASYGLEVDPGRMLGLLLRGPVEEQVREFLLAGAAAGLKGRAEG